MITIIMAVQTSMACPSQWDAWDEAGNYYYLRFRHGYGAVRRYQTENWVDAPERADPDPEDADHSRPGWALRLNSEYIGEVSHFLHGEDENLGDISLEEFCGRAGLVLAPGAIVTGFGDYLRDALVLEGVIGPEGLEESDEQA